MKVLEGSSGKGETLEFDDRLMKFNDFYKSTSVDFYEKFGKLCVRRGLRELAGHCDVFVTLLPPFVIDFGLDSHEFPMIS